MVHIVISYTLDLAKNPASVGEILEVRFAEYDAERKGAYAAKEHIKKHLFLRQVGIEPLPSSREDNDFAVVYEQPTCFLPLTGYGPVAEGITAHRNYKILERYLTEAYTFGMVLTKTDV